MSENMYSRYIIFFFLTSYAESATIPAWCSLDRDHCGRKNTVCERQERKCKPYPEDCGQNIAFGMTDDDRRDVLVHHNTLREKVASGNENRGGNTKAANMNFLNYDLELEFTAQCWCNACEFHHDYCRISPHYNLVGQAMYKYDHNDIESRPEINWKEAINMWYEGIKEYKSGPKFEFTLQSGFYTQLIWANAEKVGCGRISSVIGKKFQITYCCNYYRQGNIFNETVYESGTPCSKCNNKTCNAVFNSLCGNEEKSWEFVSPFPPDRLGYETPPPGEIFDKPIINGTTAPSEGGTTEETKSTYEDEYTAPWDSGVSDLIVYFGALVFSLVVLLLA